jgi:hypothetical protein
MSVIAIQRVLDGVLTSADSATLQILSANGASILPVTPVAPVSVGSYSYTTSFLPPGQYTAIWTFSTATFLDDIVHRAFVVDPPLQSYEGVTLMALEQRVARRSGTYRRIRGGNASTSNTVQADRLKSSLNLGSFEAEFVLRRGLMWDGSYVPNYAEDDRSRLIAEFIPTSGLVNIDRGYTLTPLENEAIEFHYLDPEEELRPAVIEGLERCYFWDTVTLAITGQNTDIAITDLVPWITKPTQIRKVEYLYTTQLFPPNKVLWWEAYQAGSTVKLRNTVFLPGSIVITALRPHSTYVNSEISYTGPNDDMDVLHVDPEYACWAGVLTLWRNNPERVQPVSAQGMRTTRTEAANEFTKLSLQISNQVPETVQWRYGNQTDINQIGNLAEPRT